MIVLPAPSLIAVRRMAALVQQTLLSRLLPADRLANWFRRSWERRHGELQGDVVDVSMNGVRFLLPGELARAFVDRRFDATTTKRVRSCLRRGMVAVDVGAHVGYYSVLFADLVRPDGHVWAVEPHPSNLSLLQKNLSRFGSGLTSIVPIAAGPRPVTRLFHLSGSGDTSGFFPHPLAATAGRIEVEQRPLDSVVSGRVDLVKIDVEGAELEVLEGMDRILGENPCLVLLLEWNPACLRAAGREPREMLDWLRDRGFRSVAICEQDEKLRSLDELQSGIDALPVEWFCNLWAERCVGASGSVPRV